MRKLTQPDLGWEVLTQPAGEVLTAEARSPGLHLGLLGVPPGFAAQDAEGWLYDVVGVTHESSATRPASRPIPALLDHALTGLLFSHGELWDRSGAPRSCSFAFVEGRGEVGFGWVGEARVSVWVDGRVREPGLITLRDDLGREARAWSIPSHHDVEVRISWWRTETDPTAGGAEVEAAWRSDGTVPALRSRLDAPAAGAARPEPVASLGVPPHAAAAADELSIVPVVGPPDGDDVAVTVEDASVVSAAVAAAIPVPMSDALATRDIATPETGSAFEQTPVMALDPAEMPDAAGVPAEVRRPGGVPGWLRTVASWFGWRPEKSLEEEEAEIWGPDVAMPTVSESADLEPLPVSEPAYEAGAGLDAVPMPEPEHVSASVSEPAVESVSEPEYGLMTPDVESIVAEAPGYDLPEMIPPRVESVIEAAASPDPRSLPVETSRRPGMPDRIPPSPEPIELSERAIPWTAADDPRAIDLPAFQSSDAFGRELVPPDEQDEMGGLRLVDIPLDEPMAETVAEAHAALSPDLPPVPDDLDSPRDAGTDAGPGTPPLDPSSLRERMARIEREMPPVPDAGWPLELRQDTADLVAAVSSGSAAPADDGREGVLDAVPADQARDAVIEPAAEHAAAPLAGAEPLATAAPLRPAWPSPQDLMRPRRLPGRRHGLWIALVGALFAGGWLVGALQDGGRAQEVGRRGAFGQVLQAVGLAGPRFVVQINSRPPGAWISVDGENLNLRTPAAVEVKPGEHTIGLSFSEYGGASFPLRGRAGDRVPLDATLWGALEIFSPSEFGVVEVTVDGVGRGFAPLRVDSLTPGVHQVRFSGSGVVAWGQTVEVRVGETHELLARAVQSPSSGVLQVDARLTDETGTQPLKGAQVWIDGELSGSTPLTLDLPRGPHSIRLAYKGQEAPVQVIDLPGGNQRFAVFELGLDTESARLVVDAPARIPRDRPTVLSATAVGVAASDVREMWLHVRLAEGAWRRYTMTLLKTPAGVAGVAAIPSPAFDAQGRARYYVSSLSAQGDEIFTEIRTLQLEPVAAR